MKQWSGVALILVIMLAGCAAVNCDPRQADLFSGISCEAGGGYAQRAQYQQVELTNTRSLALQQRAEAEAASRQATAAQSDLAARRRRLAALDGQTNALRQQLATARQNEAKDTAALQRAEAQLNALQQQRAALPEQPSEAQVEDLERQRRAVADLLTKI